jgi:intracellular septation protein
MKLLFDFFPIILFFGAFKLYGIYIATAVAIGATILQVTFTWIRYRKVEMMHWITLILITVMGGLTLYLKDEQFIKLKPSIINWLFGAAFLGSQFFGKRPFVERMMSSNIELPKPVWKRLNFVWSFYFITLGFVNLYVINNFDTDTWVNFKLFGMLGLTILFVILQALYLAKYMPKDEKEN